MKKQVFQKLVKIAIINIAVLLIALAVIIDKGIKFLVKPKHNEIIFVNPSVIRTEEFDNRLPHNAEVIYLEKDKSGILQITEYLARKEEVDAVRIISHGGNGFFLLNNEKVDSKYIAENGALFSSWKDALSENADIMLYGCKIAATEEGKNMVKQLAELTGADVAAATHEVGGVLANWTLDYRSGKIETAVLRIDDYEYHLAVVVVTNSNDSGSGSLRSMIDYASAGDEIIFMLNNPNDTIKLTSGQLVIDKTLTINGDNVIGNGDTVVVSAENNSRVFNITSAATGVTLKSLVITNAGATKDSAGIYNRGTMAAIENCKIKDNAGSGIYTSGDIEQIVNCEITGNGNSGISGSSDKNIANIVNCNISGNSVSGIDYEELYIGTIDRCNISGNTGNPGCGIFSNNYEVRLENILNSTISGNAGSGLYLHSNSDGNIGITIKNTTVTGNHGKRNGGGVYLRSGNDVTIENCTFTNNHCKSGGSTYGKGGGLYVIFSNLTVRNTIIADNYRGDGTTIGDDFYLSRYSTPKATLTDKGYNVVKYQDADDGYIFKDTTDFIYVVGSSDKWTHYNDTITAVLSLDTEVADHGGPTPTLAFSSGSFVNDAIPYSHDDNTFNEIPDIDQRGYYRALDGTGRDIGAYELGGLPPEDGDYLSQGNGLWSAAATWNIYSITNKWWGSATGQPADTNIVVVAVNDTIVINSAADADSLVLSKGSKLEITNNSTLTIDDD
jgi:parallel beta-helix repeat protein